MKVLIVSADLFEDSELEVPYKMLKESGAEVDVASIEKGTITGKHGYQVEAGLSLAEVDPNAYELLILPGGKAPSSLRKEPKALEIAQSFFDQNKLVAAICHGPQILISAGVMQGRIATGYKSIADELKDAGVVYKDREVVVDKNLITSRQPSDLPAFMKAIKENIYDESTK